MGDLGFFYHSQKEKSVAGIVEVCVAAHPDSTTDDDRWDCVDIKVVRPFVRHVSLDDIKADERLTEEEWHVACSLGATKPYILRTHRDKLASP